MSRIKGVCKGDCGSCELLANGEVDMIPCVLDQIFQRVQRNERAIERANTELAALADSKCKVAFSGVESTIEEENGLQADD